MEHLIIPNHLPVLQERFLQREVNLHEQLAMLHIPETEQHASMLEVVVEVEEVADFELRPVHLPILCVRIMYEY